MDIVAALVSLLFFAVVMMAVGRWMQSRPSYRIRRR